MNNREILSEIEKQIKFCQESSKNEAETIILEIENLISQYNAEDETEKRIKRNRLSDVDILKKSNSKSK